MNIKHFSVIAMIFLLSGCSTPLLQTQVSTPETVKRHAASLNSWHFDAKMSIKAPDQNGIVSLAWQQEQSNYDLDITAPLGQGWLKLTSTENGVTLKDSDGREDYADNANSLLVRYGYWPLPIDQFKYWLKGVAAPGTIDDMQFSKDETLKSLSQDGWQIDYQMFTKVSPALSLPRKMTLKGPKLEIKLIIKQWQI